MISPSTEITVEYDWHIHVSLKDCHWMTLLAAFVVVLPQQLTEFLENILLGYARQVMAWPRKLFAYDRCGNDCTFIWKVLGGVQGKPEGSADPDSDHLHLGEPAPVAGPVLGVRASVLPDSPALRDGAPGADSEGGVPEAGIGRGVGFLSGGGQDREHLRRTIAKMTIWKAVYGGQRSLTKRRLKTSPLPSIPTKPLMERPMARALAFKGLPKAARK